MPRKRPVADYESVHAAVEGGMLFKEALRAFGMSASGYYKWAKSTGKMQHRYHAPQVPWSVFKAVEHEFRAAPTLTDICSKHGITKLQLYTWRRLTGGLPK